MVCYTKSASKRSFEEDWLSLDVSVIDVVVLCTGGLRDRDGEDDIIVAIFDGGSAGASLLLLPLDIRSGVVAVVGADTAELMGSC